MLFITAIIIVAVVVVVVVVVVAVIVIIIIWHYNPLLSIFIHYSGAEYLLSLIS